MTKVEIYYAPRHIIGFGPMTEANAYRALENLSQYRRGPVIETVMVGQSAAEEAFDLSNNPSREKERDEAVWIGPSLSSGDIVHVGEEKFLCLSFGWHKFQ